MGVVVAAEGPHTHPNYSSGEDYILEFRSFRFGFNGIDFSQRVETAAVELDLVECGSLDDDERTDLVQLVSSGSLDYPVSALGEYLVSLGDEALMHKDECLIYWLRELVFRGAWLDQRLMEDQLDVRFDEERGCFTYHPRGHYSREIGPPPHPTWRDVAYRK
jgi:hypothetical protein